MTVTVKPDELRKAASALSAWADAWVEYGGLRREQAALAFRLLADMIESVPAREKMALQEEIDGLRRDLEEMAAEKNEILRQLMTARQQTEQCLAAMITAYNAVRGEQARDSLERMSKVNHPMEGNL